MRIYTAVGAVIVAAVLLGNLVPGLAFHIYFGTKAGALAWHARHSVEDAQ